MNDTRHDFLGKAAWMGLVASVCFALSVTAAEKPLFMLRLCAGHTGSEEQWRKTLKSIAENPGCCDEIWFSTGETNPSLEGQRAQARRIASAMDDVRRLGIVPSLQIESTIGHGDQFIRGADAESWHKEWRGWTGSTGVECRYCNCPRQPGFLAYMRETARIFAKLKPHGFWIDDDLRYRNHRPATDNSRFGCWCPDCIAAYNDRTGRSWTRETLDRAMTTDPALEADWLNFSSDSLAGVACAIAEAFRATSPDTLMALQFSQSPNSTNNAARILRAMAAASGHPVGGRTGGGAYSDLNPNNPVCKSFWSARCIRMLNLGDLVSDWCPEIESYPRAYATRSARGILLEGFSALGWGFESLSMLILDWRSESDEFYSESILRPLAKARQFLADYRKANEGSVPAGFDIDIHPEQWDVVQPFIVAGVPLLAAPGKSFLKLDKTADLVNPTKMTTAELLRFRDDVDRRAGGTPAVIRSRFVGPAILRVDSEGKLRTLGLVSTRIEPQGPVSVRVAVPEGALLIWRELEKQPVELPLERRDDGMYVTIPGLGAWTCGYLCVKYRR